MDVERLEDRARAIRLTALERVAAKGKGHLGSSYSCVDILVALYYGGILRLDPTQPKWEGRDRFFMSKGHACLALYPILVDLGYLSETRAASYLDDGGLGGQLDTSIPGVDWNTGSLGHSVGVCAGIALSAKLAARSYRAITLVGDAECGEGSFWEGLTFAGTQGLDNLIVIVDRNRLSVLDSLDDQSFFRDFPRTVETLGWQCLETDGHDLTKLVAILNEALGSDRPSIIIANTRKGKGVSFMENDPKWHHMVPNADHLDIARSELRSLSHGG